MLALLDLFDVPDVADELGISSIRDAFANTLFPGTAYQQDGWRENPHPRKIRPLTPPVSPTRDCILIGAEALSRGNLGDVRA